MYLNFIIFIIFCNFFFFSTMWHCPYRFCIRFLVQGIQMQLHGWIKNAITEI